MQMYQSIVVRDAFSASNCDAPNNSSRQNKENFYDRVKKENIIYTRLIILSLASFFQLNKMLEFVIILSFETYILCFQLLEFLEGRRLQIRRSNWLRAKWLEFS